MKNRFVVTGGAGFIGSNFVRHCLAVDEVEVVVLDKLTYAGNLASLEDVADHERFSFVQGDIADVDVVRDLIHNCRPSAVLNFAAETHVDRSIEDPEAFVRTNVTGTWRLLEESRRFWSDLEGEARRNFRFLQVSTDEVYGSLGEEGAFREDTPVAPNSPYSASKASADHFVRAYGRTFGLPVLITNCSNNYGPYQFPEKLIPLMTLNAVEGQPLPIYGDGSHVRDWLFVEDHCVGIREVLRRGRPGQSYNLGGNCELSNLELVDLLCGILDEIRPASRNPALRDRDLSSYAELKEFVEDRPGHDQRYAIDITKIKTELGWEPAHDVREGLEATVRWYLENLDWCETVQKRGYRRERLGLLDTGE